MNAEKVAKIVSNPKWLFKVDEYASLAFRIEDIIAQACQSRECLICIHSHT